MKKAILSIAIVAAFSGVSFAQDAAIASNVDISAAGTSDEDKGGDKTKVDAAALPDAVKKTLASDAYKDWTLVEAWHVAGKKEHYVLEMKKGAETTKLKINKEGQVI